MTPSPDCDFSGRCLCGAARFHRVTRQPGLRACHCRQCRRWSGHVWAGVISDRLDSAGEVRWFRSSEAAERAFCPECGSSLFWRAIGSDAIDVAPGAVDEPTGLRLIGHIFAADKGGYYQIGDGLPQQQGG